MVNAPQAQTQRATHVESVFGSNPLGYRSIDPPPFSQAGIGKEGYSLEWPAYAKPVIRSPDGSVLNVVMRGTVPTLSAGVADGNVDPAPDATAAESTPGDPFSIALDAIFDEFFKSSGIASLQRCHARRAIEAACIHVRQAVMGR